jgi:hypothetical protein
MNLILRYWDIESNLQGTINQSDNITIAALVK